MVAGLAELDERQLRAQQRIQEVGERQVIDTDARTNALAERRGVEPPSPSAVARMQDRHIHAGPFDRWRHETWMGADIDKPAAGSKNAMDFREDGSRIIEGGMRQHRDDSLERIIFEWQVRGIGLHEYGIDSVRDRKLVSRYVDTHHLPSGGDQSRNREACPAAQIETPPSASTEKLEGAPMRHLVQRQSRNMVPVPLCEPVVPCRTMRAHRNITHTR
jgi:hypothetical protein